MRERSYKMFVQDILQSMNKVERYLHGLNYDGFEKNELIVDAVTRNLEIIGEASKNVPENICARFVTTQRSERTKGFFDHR